MGSSSGTGCRIVRGWSDGMWRSGRWTHRKCYSDWTALRGRAQSSRKPMWLPKASSTGRRWWAHGRSSVRQTPRSAHQHAWCPLGSRQPDGLMPATCGVLPSSGAPSRRPTCRHWRKRSGTESWCSQGLYFSTQGGGNPGLNPTVTVGQAMAPIKSVRGFPGRPPIWRT